MVVLRRSRVYLGKKDFLNWPRKKGVTKKVVSKILQGVFHYLWQMKVKKVLQTLCLVIFSGVTFNDAHSLSEEQLLLETLNFDEIRPNIVSFYNDDEGLLYEENGIINGASRNDSRENSHNFTVKPLKFDASSEDPKSAIEN